MNEIRQGDALETLRTLASASVDCCVTSPPYWALRDYGVEGQIGLEDTPEQFIANMVLVFREIRRVLKPTGTLWLNIGDSYARGKVGRSDDNCGELDGYKRKGTGPTKHRALSSNLKNKDMVGIPWMLAFALRADGWYLRQDIIWHKPNPMPESVSDRCTKAHEYVFLLSVSEKYYFDSLSIKEPRSLGTSARRAYSEVGGHAHSPGDHETITHASTKKGRKLAVAGSGTKQNASYNAALRDIVDERNKRSVWSVGSMPFPEAHFATFPEKLIEPMILAGCPTGGGRARSIHGRGHHRARCQETRPSILRYRTQSRIHCHGTETPRQRPDADVLI